MFQPASYVSQGPCPSQSLKHYPTASRILPASTAFASHAGFRCRQQDNASIKKGGA
ncbi:MAG: hypothetical protein HRU33_04090 [Rhodobacteraceae bacterium]|nr:hypothetical protein [Paracoccaceae bacterium]